MSDKIEANTDYLNDDCHFSENGSEEVSDALASYIDTFLMLVGLLYGSLSYFFGKKY